MLSIPAYESSTVEFKAQFGDKDGQTIKKTLVAFANTFGGDLYIGVDDDGQVIGVQNVHQLEERLWSMVRDNVFPSIVGSVETDRIEVDAKTVLHVHVERGPTPPYSLSQDDPRQVYVRVGCTSSPARIEDIARMIEASNPTPFEQRSSAVQELTFDHCLSVCQEKAVTFDPLVHTNFGFWNPKKRLWTNLARVCSDQGQSQMIMIEFRDDEKTVVADSQKITGSVFVLLQKALEFVARSNYLEMEKPTDGTLARKDHYCVPPEVVREAIVNQLAHRDYSKEVPSTIHISPSRLEFWSVGGPHDLLPEDILENMATSCRNPGLAALFNRLGLMEGLGTGYRLIQTRYKDVALSRLVQMTANSVKIVLPRRHVVKLPTLDARQERILDVVLANGSVTRRQVQDLLHVSQTAAVVLINDLVDKGALERAGSGPRTRYVIAAQWQGPA